MFYWKSLLSSPKSRYEKLFNLNANYSRPWFRTCYLVVDGAINVRVSIKQALICWLGWAWQTFPVKHFLLKIFLHSISFFQKKKKWFLKRYLEGVILNVDPNFL